MKYLIGIIVLSLLIACSEEEKVNNPQEKFRGMWKLKILEKKDSLGIWREHDWNKGGDSYILYDGLGHMAVQITPKGYSKREVKAPRTPIDSLELEELRSDLRVYASNYVYTAKCNILDEESIIEHQRLSHTYPFDWGVKVQRKFKFSGDTLFLFPVEPQNPFRLTWIKQH